MNYSEVKELLDAGFTADEIRAMIGSNPQNPQNNPQPEPKQPEPKQPEPKQPEPKQPEPKQPEPKQPELKQQDQKQPEQKQPEPAQDENFSQLSQTIEKLIKTIQVSNLKSGSFESPATPDINKQVDSIMAGIIRPEHEKKKED